MKKYIFIILLLSPIFCFAQGNSNLPQKKIYKKGEITTVDFDKYKCENIVIADDSICFDDVYSGENFSLPISQVGSMKLKAGNYFWLMAGTGIVVFTASAVTTNPHPIFVGAFAVAGIIVGGVTGLLIPKNKVYRINY